MTFILLSVMFLSCGPTPVFSDRQQLPVEGWNSSESVSYTIPVDDLESLYELQLIIGHLTDYRHQNVYFNIKTVFPDRPAKEEKLSVDLALKNGQWVGDCSSSSCKTKVYLLEKFKFPTKGAYTFVISQHTREDNLKGLSELTLQLHKLGQ